MSLIRVALKCICFLAALDLLLVVIDQYFATPATGTIWAAADHNTIVVSSCTLLLAFWLDRLISALKLSRLSLVGASLSVLMLAAGLCWGLCTHGNGISLQDQSGHAIRL